MNQNNVDMTLSMGKQNIINNAIFLGILTISILSSQNYAEDLTSTSPESAIRELDDGAIRDSDYPGLRIVETARKHLGIPYKFGGLSPSVGFDCSGLTKYVYLSSGYSIPRETDNQFDDLNEVVVPAPGDLLFFDITGKGVSHVGIYMGDFQFIHSPSTGKTVSYADIRNPYWKSRYVGSRSLFR